METRANFILIGLFTLAVIAGGFGFVYWFQHVSGSSQRVAYRVIFKGAVSGLRTGGSVVFNGIRVGEVSSIGLGDPRQVIAVLSIDKGTPVRADTSVGLEFQGLTGIAAVALKGGSVDAPLLSAKDGELPTLVADIGATQDVTEVARSALLRMDKVIEENQDALRNTMRSIDTFTAALARNSERIDNILIGVETLTGGKDRKGDLHEAVVSIKQLADNLDKRSSALISDGRRTLNDIDKAVRNFDRNPSRIIFGGSSVFPEKKRAP